MFKKVYRLTFNLVIYYLIYKLLIIDHLNLNSSSYLLYILNLNNWNFNIFYLVSMIIFFWNFKLHLKNFYIYLFFILLILLNLNFFAYINYINIITSLAIGSITIHPFLFYFVVVLFVYKNSKICKWDYFKLINVNYIFILKVGVFSLFLGGLWGLQSITWGFIWVNDIIEWLFLYLLIFIMYILHKFYLNKVFIFGFFIFLFLNFLFGVRLNFFNSRHSFFSTTDLSIFIFVVNLLFLTNITYSFSLKISYNTIKTINQTFYIFFFFISYFYVYCVFFKYFSIFFICWGFFKISKKYLIHFFLFFLFFLFNSYISLFFIELKFYENFKLASLNLYTNIMLTNFITQLQTFGDFLLEGVSFSLSNCTYNNFLLLKLTINLYFNNLLLLLPFLFVLLLFKKGWI